MQNSSAIYERTFAQSTNVNGLWPNVIHAICIEARCDMERTGAMRIGESAGLGEHGWRVPLMDVRNRGFTRFVACELERRAGFAWQSAEAKWVQLSVLKRIAHTSGAAGG